MSVRAARAEDAAAVAEIYNAGIRERTSTFETREREPREMAERIASERHPFLVAELDGRVAGFAATSSYSGRDVYAGVAECSPRGGGGRRGFHKLLGKLFSSNEASMRLVARGGFRVVGTHHRHGRLDGEWLDVILVERLLAGQPTMG